MKSLGYKPQDSRKTVDDPKFDSEEDSNSEVNSVKGI